MQSRTVVILGGGIGGIIAANELRKRLPRDHRVVLTERDVDHAFAPSFLWLMVGQRRPAEVRRPLATLLRSRIELVHGEVVGINLRQRKVVTDTGEFSYDYLVIALGAELATESIPGMSGAAHTFYTFEGSIRLRDAVRDFSAGVVAVVVSALPFKCPAAPYEGALLLADYFRKRGVSERVSIHLFTPETQPMPVAGPQLGEAVKSLLKAKGVSFHPLHALKSVDTEKRELAFRDHQPFPYDLLVTVPPHRVPQVIREAGLTDKAHWISVNPKTLATDYDGVYAIGDITAIPIPGRWRPDIPLMLPKAGVFAHLQAQVVAERIAGEICGRPSPARFCGDGYCMLEAGEDLAGFAFGDFFAEPSPRVHLKNVGRAWHLGKVLFEKWWLSPLGFERRLLGWALKGGGKLYGIRVAV